MLHVSQPGGVSHPGLPRRIRRVAHSTTGGARLGLSLPLQSLGINTLYGRGVVNGHPADSGLQGLHLAAQGRDFIARLGIRGGLRPAQRTATQRR